MTSLLTLAALVGAVPAAVQVHAPVKAIHGKWSPQVAEYEGISLFDKNYETFQRLSFKVQDSKVTVFVGEKSVGVFEIKLDAASNPRQFELVREGVVRMRGIYFLDGNYMVVCVAIGTSNPPKQFNSGLGPRTWMFILDRQ